MLLLLLQSQPTTTPTVAYPALMAFWIGGGGIAGGTRVFLTPMGVWCAL